MGLANNNVTVLFAPPTPGMCTPSSMAVLANLLNTLVSADVTSTGNTSFFNFGDTEPTAENRIYPWLKTISGRPDNWYVYEGGEWQAVNPQRVWFMGIMAGLVNVYTANTIQTYPSLLTLTVGDVFTASANITNTGPATLSVNGLAAAPITIGTGALVGGELVGGLTYIFIWDGTRFRLLNGSVVPPVPTIAAQFVYQESTGTIPVVIIAGNTAIPFNIVTTPATFAALGGGGAVTLQAGTYLITASVALEDVPATAGGEVQLGIKNGVSFIGWQDSVMLNVDMGSQVTCSVVLVVPAAGTASITANIWVAAAGSIQYAVATTAPTAERPASLTILKFA